MEGTKLQLRCAKSIHGKWLSIRFSSLPVSAIRWLTISRVPKELISRFVKLCPTCQVRRGSARPSPPDSDHDSYMHTRSPGLISPPQSRRESIATRRSSISLHSPIALVGGTSEFQRQNRWMIAAQPSQASSTAPPTNLPATTYNTLPTNPSMSGLSSLNNTHGPNGNHMNFNTSVHTDNQSSYSPNGIRFAHTSQSAFPYQSMKQEGHY